MSFENLKRGGKPAHMFGPMFESVQAKPATAAPEITEQAFFDSADGSAAMDDAMAKAALQSYRADSMAMIMEWVADGDDSADALDAYAQGMADADEDGEINPDDEQDEYENYLTLMAEAMVYLGVPEQAATDAMSGDDSASAQAFIAAGDALAADGVDQDSLIAEFSVRETVMLESIVKVIRNGVLKQIRRPLRKKILSSAQRSALKKARMKANTGAARASRRKSLKIRTQRGLS